MGFGACMISGFPFSEETGFLSHALRKLHRDRGLQVRSETVTLGGFPAQRAQKHLRKKILDQQPDIVVLQFGSTDASAPLRRSGLVRLWVEKPDGDDHVSSEPASWKHVLKWRLWGVASAILRVKPVASLAEYLAAMDAMVKECIASGCVVVVISPFIMGSGHSNRLARHYSRALGKNLARHPECIFLDAHSLLQPLPCRQILLRDGFHLSTYGHELLGEKLAGALWQAARTSRS